MLSGLRVRKVSSAGTFNYVFDLHSHPITEINASINMWTRGEIYAGARHVATYSGGTTYFSYTDWLGTERARAGVNATVTETCKNLPFGDGQACTGTESSPLHFTGKQRDTETGLDDFPARYYSSTQGRWYSPDWSPVPVAIPYAYLHNPQTLNLYDYVGDDPTNHADADGHVVSACGDKTQGTEAAGNGEQAPPVTPAQQSAAQADHQTNQPAERSQANCSGQCTFMAGKKGERGQAATPGGDGQPI